MKPTTVPPRHGPSIAYSENGFLTVDGHSVAEMAAQHGTPFYVYSAPAAIAQYKRIFDAFTPKLQVTTTTDADDDDINNKQRKFCIHYAVKANCSMALMKELAALGCGFDCVSALEVKKVLLCGAKPDKVVFAGVGKSEEELQFAVDSRVGHINCENEYELTLLQKLMEQQQQKADGNQQQQQPHVCCVALRLNPDVQASTHPSISTGQKAAKFGLPVPIVQEILKTHRERWPLLRFVGLHVHIGSQLGNTGPTARAVQIAADLLEPYRVSEGMTWLDIGGGFPVPYENTDAGNALPEAEDFAAAIAPIVKGRFDVGVEPGRYIVARSGLLVSKVLYRKEQDGKRMVIVDASMVELMRPALYGAVHTPVPIVAPGKREKEDASAAAAATPAINKFEIVGPVCESTDVLCCGVPFEDEKMQPGCLIAFCTAGAYCSVLASNYNARLRPPELLVTPDGTSCVVARRREKFEQLVQDEVY